MALGYLLISSAISPETVTMTQQPLSSLKGQHHLLLLQGLGYLVPLGLLSGGMTLAQASPTSSVQPLPSFNESQSSSVLEPIQASEQPSTKPALPDYESVPPLRVNESEATRQASSPPKPKPKLKPIQPLVNSSPSSVPEVSSEPPPSSSETVTESPKPSSPPTVTFEPTEQETENPPTVQQPETQPSSPTTNETDTATREFIDLSGYSDQGQPNLPEPRVEVSDRANQCTTVIENGQLVSGSCNVSENNNNAEPGLVDIGALPELPQTFQKPVSPRKPEVRATYTPPEDLPQLKLPGNGDSRLLFPLARATAISSNYGWRIHPIFGNRRFHTGTDFTAPEGTPVVATKSGRVVLADYSSGYGLIVGIRHDGSNESRYAHLSQIHVKPGQWVEQGTVIGRVGSTGLSTGPHLHFEWRIRKGSRWIAVNAGEELIAARNNLDPNRIVFRDIEDGDGDETGNNFLAYLPEVFASLPSLPASWMSLPELSFLNQGDFKQAYQRRASLNRFSQRSQSVLVLPFSLPKVLASVFNWDPPQLFTQENLQQVSTQPQPSWREEFAYRPPSVDASDNMGQYEQLSDLLFEQDNLESVTNVDGLSSLNFPLPRSEGSQKLFSERQDQNQPSP